MQNRKRRRAALDGAAQFAGRSGMSASAAREKGNGDADMPEMKVEIGREVEFVPSTQPSIQCQFEIARLESHKSDLPCRDSQGSDSYALRKTLFLTTQWVLPADFLHSFKPLLWKDRNISTALSLHTFTIKTYTYFS